MSTFPPTARVMEELLGGRFEQVLLLEYVFLEVVHRIKTNILVSSKWSSGAVGASRVSRDIMPLQSHRD